MGDILEWVAAAFLVAAGFLGGWLLDGLILGLILAFLAVFGCLAYLAQCHADIPLRKPPQ